MGGPSAGVSSAQNLEYIAPPRKFGGGGATDTVARLTGRVTDPLRDVVQYHFKVIMRPQDIQRLFRQLEGVNYHTVLDCRVESIKSGPTAPVGIGGGMGEAIPETMYYYGPDPVVEVTIVGELQLLAAWTRGTWNEEKKDWADDAKPLMPMEMLMQISQKDPAALRPKDQQSLPAGTGSGTPNGGGSASPSPYGSPSYER
jgi:hypothetical protein